MDETDFTTQIGLQRYRVDVKNGGFVFHATLMPCPDLGQILRNGFIANWESGKSHMTVRRLNRTLPG